MSKYALVFKSKEAFDWSKLPQEEVQNVAGAWKGWIASMGSAVQAGDAFKFGGKSVSKTGTADADNLLTGYVVVEADGFSAAEKLAAGAPSVASGQGSIEIYELLPQHQA
jgi:hypothetical protein